MNDTDKLRRKRRYICLIAFALAIVALDQLTKQLVACNIPENGIVPVLPGVFHLTYIRNTGAAFSLLPGKSWLFLGVTALYFIALPFLIKKKIISAPFELWCMAAISGGAVGNLIDRLLTGEVVDMVAVEFIRFAVFNVADSFITCGAIALLLYMLNSWRKEQRGSKEHDADK